MRGTVNWMGASLVVAAVLAAGCGGGEGKVKYDKRLDEAMAKLKDPDPKTRWSAAYELSTLMDPRVVDPLIETLKDEDREVRAQAAAALGINPDPRAVEPLIALFKDADPHVRANAAGALGSSADPRAIEALTRLLKTEKHEAVRMSATRALQMLQKKGK